MNFLIHKKSANHPLETVNLKYLYLWSDEIATKWIFVNLILQNRFKDFYAIIIFFKIIIMQRNYEHIN
jgi:hypothetical protein